jgi:hypothetical protein
VSSGGTTSFTITGLTNGQGYDVELRTVNSVGAGPTSDGKQVTPESGSSEWTPADLPGLLACWDISDLSSLFQERTGGGSTPAVVDGVVGTVRDLSRNGRHFAEPSDAARPILRQDGDLYYLEFDGTDDKLLVSYTKSQPWVRIAAWDNGSHSGNVHLFNASSGNSGVLYFGTATGLRMHGGAEANIATKSADTPVVTTERHNGTSSRGAVNNGTYANVSAGTTAANGICAGGSASGNPSPLRLYAAIESDDDLGDADIAQARMWAGTRVGPTL